MTHQFMILRNGVYLLRRPLSQVQEKKFKSEIWTQLCVNCSKNFATASLLPKRGKISTDKKEKEIKVKSKALPAASKTILQYAGKQSGITSERLSDVLPKRLLTYSSITPKLFYLIDEKIARNISQFIKSENIDKESPVIELQSGLGLLTSELLKSVGFKFVTCLEDHVSLSKDIAKKFKVSVIECGMNSLPRQHHLDKHDGGERINSFLSSITTSENLKNISSGKPKKQLYIVGAIPHVSSINFLIRCYATKRVFFEDDLPWSGVTFFAVLGAKALHICTATPKTGLVAYRPTSVFCQTLFTFKEMATIPRQAFLPWETEDLEIRKGPKTRKLKVADPSNLKLVRIDINKEVQEKVGKDNLFTYWYFVRQHLHTRKDRIIPELERWVPGCGVALIKKGFTIFSQFGTMEPHEILDLYLQFVSLPEFANSSFLSAVEKYQMRLELTEEDDDNKQI